MAEHAMESKLRPAVELYTVAICIAAAVLCVYSPWAVALSPEIGLVAALAGIWICGATARDWGTHDHGAIVWDEVVGYALTVQLAACWLEIGPLQLLLAFVLFRLFDILKPWPIRYLDRQVHGGIGIMVDDLLAGIFAALVMVSTLLLA